MIVLGDSILNTRNRIFSKSAAVNVRFYTGATTKDIRHHLRPATRKKHEEIITHADTNDLTNDINTMKYANSITKIIEEMNDGDDTQVGN